MKIRLCEHNQGAEKLSLRLKEQFPDLNIKVKKCVKQCKTCKMQPFALVAKKPVFASDVDQLYTAVVRLFGQAEQADE